MNSWNSVDEIKNYLLPLGFKEFEPPKFRSYEGITTMFQKRYDDEIGKKYFIDAKIWDYTKYPQIPEKFHIEYEGQYYQKGTHDAVNFNFIDWTLDQVEEFIDNLFELGVIEHYERD